MVEPTAESETSQAERGPLKGSPWASSPETSDDEAGPERSVGPDSTHDDSPGALATILTSGILLATTSIAVFGLVFTLIGLGPVTTESGVVESRDSDSSTSRRATDGRSRTSTEHWVVVRADDGRHRIQVTKDQFSQFAVDDAVEVELSLLNRAPVGLRSDGNRAGVRRSLVSLIFLPIFAIIAMAGRGAASISRLDRRIKLAVTVAACVVGTAYGLTAESIF